MEEQSFDDVASGFDSGVVFQESQEEKTPISNMMDAGNLQARRKRLELILEKQRLDKELLDYYDQ